MQAIEIASASGYDGIELRFVENEDSLWKLPAFGAHELPATKRALKDHGLVISCVDTSCRFHFPDPKERARWIEEGERHGRSGRCARGAGHPGVRRHDSARRGSRFDACMDRRVHAHSWRRTSIRPELRSGSKHTAILRVPRRRPQSFRRQVIRRSPYFGIPQTVSSNRKSPHRRARLDSAPRSAMCISKICSSSATHGRLF